MTITSLTPLLEKILIDYQKKENKNYLTWETLRTKLGNDRRKFGLTTKSTWQELKSAIEPHLGLQYMFSEHFGQWYFSARIPLEALREEIASEKTELLQARLAKEKKCYMLLKSLTKIELASFGLPAKPSVSEQEKALTPFLGSALQLLKKKPPTAKGKDTLYLAYKVPAAQFVEESLQIHYQKKPFALKKAADDVPLSAAQFLEVFNHMLAAGQVQVTKMDEKFVIAGIKLTETKTVGSFSPPQLSASEPNDYEMFRRAFDKLDQGRIYVRICNMRRELGWDEERFDTLLRKLRADGIIQLHGGDPINFTAEELRRCFTDEYGSFYATLTWKKR